jgi:hypothetical protein
MTLEEHAKRAWRLDCWTDSAPSSERERLVKERDDALAALEHEIEQASTSDLLTVFTDSRSRSERVRGALAKEIDARIPRRRA